MPKLHDSMVRPEQAEATERLLEQSFPINQTTVIRPGDHLIVRIEDDHLTMDDADKIKRMILDQLPLLGGVTVVRADGLFVFRDEAHDD